MGVLDDILNRRRGTLTRQEAVAPTPQQAIAQTSQSAPLQDNSRRQPYRATGAGGFTTYKDRNGKIQMVGVPGATIVPGQGNRSSDVDTEAQQQGKFHINGLGAADGTVTQPEQTEIPHRTHQTAGGAAMPVGSNTGATAGTVTQPGQVITPQQAKDAVDKVAQDIQQRADARRQEELARNRHQNSADPMNRLFNPVNPQQPQQSSGTVNQATPDQVPQVTDMNGLLELLARDSKRKLDEETETPEQKVAREKREKRQALMAKIGDGLGAFHEAYSYMMGNKPMTSGSLSAAQEARIKALGLERDKKYNDALNNYLKVMDAQRKNDYYNSIAETRRAEQESRDASRRSKEAREQEKLDLQKLLREDKQRTQSEKSSFWDAYWYARDVEGRSEEDAKKYASEYSFKVREQENANEQALNDAKVKKEQSATQKNQAQAAKTKAGGSGKSSSGYTTTTTTYDKNGKVKGTKVTTKTPGGSRSSKKPKGNGKKPTKVNWKK